jgi:energy-coupling factor transporter ATP-binding protein EcfA2
MKVEDIPISSPTIVAGHNDGGKTALLASLAFLLGQNDAAEEDRSYVEGPPGSRCESTDTEGLFELDEWEQETFHLPPVVKIRRFANDESSQWECWKSVPQDQRLRNLTQYKLPELVELVRELDLKPASSRKADNLAALEEHARAHSTGEDWTPVPKELVARLPRLLRFDGKAARANDAVKAALASLFQSHVQDPELQGRLHKIEDELKDRLRTESKSLCDHIKHRCPDITEISVEPEISFNHGFRSAELHMTRNSSGPVDMTRSGDGSGRRVALAIWEWNGNLLSQQNASEPNPADLHELMPSPPQTIIVYDEPDTHLDYAHQRKVMELIREQSAIPNVNVIVATHSMNLIDGVDIADVVHLKLIGGYTTVERLGTETHEEIDRFIGKISASVGLRNSVLLHERCFMAVEGDTEQQSIPLLFHRSEGVSLQAAGIALWACNNNEGALHLAKYLFDHGRRVRLLVDADSRRIRMFQDTSLEMKFGLRKEQVVTFVGEPDGHKELEELFPDDLWARVANERWTRSSSPWTAADFAQHRSGKFSSKVQEMLQNDSESGPGGKTAMMHGLALSLHSPDEVPSQLREVFKEIRELAAE